MPMTTLVDRRTNQGFSDVCDLALGLMRYTIELKPRAEKDLRSIDLQDRERIIARLRLLEADLGGDVKRLSNFTPEYRMRAGDWRALFEVAGDRVVVYRILHRRDAYR
jgi:mRNA interferase RelE/StbE